jgi:hypothetical protein
VYMIVADFCMYINLNLKLKPVNTNHSSILQIQNVIFE